MIFVRKERNGVQQVDRISVEKTGSYAEFMVRYFLRGDLCI